jgi:surfeit locus 1 family protein
MTVTFAILCALGTWQVKRMFWKEQLIKRVEARLESKNIEINMIADAGFDKEQHEYQPVKATGTFDHSKEVYFFTTGKSGQSGWNVHTPLSFENGKTLIVNRGFVPFSLKNQSERKDGQVDGVQSIEGLLRFPLLERPLGSLENNADKREFYWRNVSAMSSAMDLQTSNVLPVILDQRGTEQVYDWPRGGTTIIDFPNNHLQYVITWFGLALTLLGVGGYFLYMRRGNNDE